MIPLVIAMLTVTPPKIDPAWWWVMCIDLHQVLHAGDCGVGYVKRRHAPGRKR